MNPIALFAFNFLLNALWQIPLVFCAAYLAIRLARRNGPQWEHRIWVGALFLELLLPFGQLNLKPLAAYLIALFAPATPSTANGSVQVFTSAAPVAAPAWNLPPALIALALAAYAAAILYFTSRLLWRLHKTSALRRHAHAIAPTEYPVLQKFLNTHPAPLELLVSPSVSGPAIIGILRPALLLPPGFLDRTEASDIEAALAHELAHLRRRDYTKNLCYEILALPIAWHPLVWLTRARISESREILCDHLAAHSTPSRHDYARALLRLASQQSGSPSQPIHAIGIFDTQSLERRIMNLTQLQIRNSITRRLLTLTACTALAIATGASALALHVEAAATSSYSQQASSKPVHVTAKVMSGNRIGGKAPKYPVAAKKKHIQGTVVLRVLISKQGTIANLEVISGPAALRESALKAVLTWHYKPFLLNGNPVAVTSNISVVYSLDDKKTAHTTAKLSNPEIRQMDAASTPTEEHIQGAVDIGGSAMSIGGGVSAPRLIHSVQANFTNQARQAKYQGVVAIQFIVDRNGDPENIHVIRHLGMGLDQKAIESVRQYKFKPAMYHGHPVPVQLAVDVSFHLY